jgi:lipoyl synthase
MSETSATDRKPRRLPPWLTKRLTLGADRPVRDLLRDLDLNTVCRSAQCPNCHECYGKGRATFLVMGPACTRSCRFCAVDGGPPAPLDPGEPARVAEACRRLELRHAVVTSVTRDDLPDGGAEHFARTITRVRERAGCTVEVLVPDFQGDAAALATVLDAAPEILNHNIETVPRLYPEVRAQADYARSLALLERARAHAGTALVKSGLMLGLGEREEEVLATCRDLAAHGVQLLTLGQYLSPGPGHLPVERYVEPDRKSVV